MISFFAYHQDPERRQRTIDRIVGLIRSGGLTSGGEGSGGRMNLVVALGDGTYDVSLAYHYTGFTAPLLVICAAIHDGLPLEEAPDFTLSLVKAASLDADISDVPEHFLKWMFEEAVRELGSTRIRTTARETGQGFEQVTDMHVLTPAQQMKTKSLVKRARRQGLASNSPEEALIEKALAAAMDRAGEHAGLAVHWVAGLSAHPAEQYRRYARKMLKLVETA